MVLEILESNNSQKRISVNMQGATTFLQHENPIQVLMAIFHAGLDICVHKLLMYKSIPIPFKIHCKPLQMIA